jgi:ankyrin repeat protein
MCDGHTDIVEVLLGAAADPNRPDCQQRTPLHLGALKGHIDIVRVLGAVADANRPNKQQRTPLHVAAEYGYTDIVQVLLCHLHGQLEKTYN